MFGLGWTEIVLIILVILLLFGAKRIPDVMRSVGKGINEFKKGMQGLADDPGKEEKEKKSEEPEKK